ncbi:MAG: tyrosine-type recombinase/integrase [Acidobacteria bacterium]|nr:tyrosine-type recombinase/integrase [Acidobacteriota bacterium]
MARPIEPHELKEVVGTCHDDEKGIRDRALLLLQFVGGFRLSECLALKVEDVFFIPTLGMDIRVVRSKTDQEFRGRWVAVPRQEGDFCPVKAVERRIGWMEAQGGKVFDKKGRPIPLGQYPLFSPRGKPGRHLHIRNAQLMIDERGAEACIKGITSHSLRAGFVTTALERGMTPLDVARVTGHKRIEMVARYDRRNRWVNPAGKGIME